MLAVAAVADALFEHQLRIAEAHEFGIHSGDCQEAGSPERFRESMPVVAETMPPSWIKGMAVGASETALLMRDHDAHPDIRNDWDTVTVYLENLAAAFTEYLEDPDYVLTVDLIDAFPPPAVLRYDVLAAGMHPDATRRMVATAICVRAYALREGYEVSDEELNWLRALATGERGLDVGTRFGFSERAFYRAQQELWAKLGVDSRSEAFVRATELGWL